MQHLAEIEDWATRNAVDTVQGQFELMLLQLLPDDRGEAIAYLREARDRTVAQIKAAGSEFVAIDVQAKSGRIALAILEKTFERLIEAVNG